MTTPEEIEAFIRGTRPPWNVARQAFDWYGMCAGLTYRTILECGGKVPDGPYNSAWAAYLATTIESTDPRNAPPGAVHYWDYTGLASNGQRARWGHVTLDIFGGGTDTLGATGHAHEVWNTSAGLISVAAQTARGMTYMGWSRTYGRSNRISITTGAPAGGNGRPFPEEDDMALFAKHIDTRPRKLPKGGWHNVYLNEKNHTSFASGRCIVQSTVVVQLVGLPVGAEVQFRLVTTKAGTNDVRGGTTAREAVGTAGTTYATVTDSIELTRPDDGLRWQMVVQHDGVEVKRTEVSAVIHPAR